MAIFAFVLSGCAQSASEPDSSNEAIYQQLPQDEINDTARTSEVKDATYDVLRADNTFAFQSLLPVSLQLSVQIYDISNDADNKIVASSIRLATASEANLTKNPVVATIKDANGKIVYTGAFSDQGNLSTTILLPSAPADFSLNLDGNGLLQRELSIENLVQYQEINRILTLARSPQSASSNALNDSDGDLIPDLYDAFPDDPDRSFSVNIPADGTLTIAFEDNFPNLGDGDYNDFIASYRIT